MKRVDLSTTMTSQEITALQKVIEIQQVESRKLQEHVNLLETELDSIQEVVGKLQKKINVANDQIAEKDTKITSLEEMLGAAQIDKRAFETFSSQNKMILDKYLHEQKESVKSYEETTKLKQNMKAIEEAVESKVEQMTQKEIEYTSEIRHLKAKLSQESALRHSLQDQLEVQKNQFQTMSIFFQQQYELKTDELRRFKQLEYQNLFKSDQKSFEIYRLKDDYETLQDTLQLSSLQSTTLSKRLEDTMKESNDANNLLYQFVQQTEERNLENRRRENGIERERDFLKDEVIRWKKVIREVCERNDQLEKELKQQHIERVVRGEKGRKGKKEKSGPNLSMSHSSESSGIRTGKPGARDFKSPIMKLGWNSSWMTMDTGIGSELNLHSSSQTILESGESPSLEENNVGLNSSSASLPLIGKHQSNGRGNSQKMTKLRTNVGEPEGHRDSLSPDAHLTQIPVPGIDLEHSFFELSNATNQSLLDQYDQHHNNSVISASSEEGGGGGFLPMGAAVGSSTVDMFQYQGKKCLLAKYLRLIVTLINTYSIPPSLKVTSIDLSRASLIDQDILQVIDWLRLISIQEIRFIDFRSNLLTDEGMSYLVTWLLSLEKKELVERNEPLTLCCQSNMVDPITIPNILAKFYKTPHPEIKYIETEQSGNTIVVYGNQQTSQKKGRLILRWCFENNFESQEREAGLVLSAIQKQKNKKKSSRN